MKDERRTLPMSLPSARTAAAMALACLFSSAVGGAQPQPRKPAETSPESLTAQEREMLALAQDLAKRSGDALERWIAAGEVSEEKLFARLYYPIPKTRPPKYNTDWDKLADRDLQPLEEAAKTKSSSVAFAVVVDVAGYLPTHNLEYSRPLTGDLSVDVKANRTKRIFTDRAGLASARSTAPFLLQVYVRDTGERLGEISAPITVRGKHWGAARVGFKPQQES
jgi:methyl-accepting chemotaxis protein